MNEQIVSIESIECHSLRYDIEVSDNNNFYANGILVHNCQNLTNKYDFYKTLRFDVTEKLHGSSMTAYLKDGVFGVCSRNIDLLETEGNSFWKIARELKIEEALRGYGGNIAIQGELVGHGLNGNMYVFNDQNLYLFGMFDIDKREYLPLEQELEFCNEYNIEHVPVLSREFQLPPTIDELLILAEGKSAIGKAPEREGVVVRHDYRDQEGLLKISFKVISNKFLLKEKD